MGKILLKTTSFVEEISFSRERSHLFRPYLYYYVRESSNNNKIPKNTRRDGPRLCPKDPAAARCIGSQPRSLLSPTPFPSAAAGASHTTAVRPCGFLALDSSECICGFYSFHLSCSG